MENSKALNYEDAKYRIFEYFKDEHDIVLLDSEIFEIADLCQQFERLRPRFENDKTRQSESEIK